MWALLYGKGDFSESILLAARAGYDTDCTAATVGAILGAAFGLDGIPHHWVEPIGSQILIGPGIQGINAPGDVHQLTERILRLRRDLDLDISPPVIDLPIPGRDISPSRWNVLLHDHSGLPVGSWKNGQLPPAVLQSGGADWSWTVNGSAGKPFRLICLCPAGAKLRVDGEVLIDCPPGLDFIPATHRCPAESCATFIPIKSEVKISVELPPGRKATQAEVLLADDSFHLAPWNGEPLLHPAALPATLK